MSNRSVRTATRWVEAVLLGHGWPPVPYRFLAQLSTHIGQDAVQHYDCSVSAGAGERSAPDATATIVVFTVTHLIVQTVDCHQRARRFASDVQVLRRGALASLASRDVDTVHLPWLRRVHDALTDWCGWLADAVEAAVDRYPWLERWYVVSEPDGDVVVDLTYRGLREQVLTLPMGEQDDSAQRLTRFLPSLAMDLG